MSPGRLRKTQRKKHSVGHLPLQFSREANGNQQIAELVLGDLVTRLDDRGAVELLENRRPLEHGIERQLLTGIDRRLAPAVGEPDAALTDLRGLERRRALAC